MLYSDKHSGLLHQSNNSNKKIMAQGRLNVKWDICFLSKYARITESNEDWGPHQKESCWN